jgi:MerR family transcriptional regulator, thiopeptide resistance regulator
MTTTHHDLSDDGRSDEPVAATSVIPVLVYEDIQAAHDFLVATFGFASGGVFRAEDGSVVHAEVRAGDQPIWLHRVSPEHEMASPTGASASHGGLDVMVPDVDAHFARTKAAGARIDRAPGDQDYGLREYGARDLEGHRWWFASPLAD